MCGRVCVCVYIHKMLKCPTAHGLSFTKIMAPAYGTQAKFVSHLFNLQMFHEGRSVFEPGPFWRHKFSSLNAPVSTLFVLPCFLGGSRKKKKIRGEKSGCPFILELHLLSRVWAVPLLRPGFTALSWRDDLSLGLCVERVGGSCDDFTDSCCKTTSRG